MPNPKKPKKENRQRSEQSKAMELRRGDLPHPLLVWSDSLEDEGDSKCWDVRSVGNILCQLCEILPVSVCSTLHPTGSRYYGDYWTEESDWDYFCLWEGKKRWQAKKPLVNWGWETNLEFEEHRRSGALDDLCMYKGSIGCKVNLIIKTCPEEYKVWTKATKECLQVWPKSRRKALKVFQKYNVKMTRKGREALEDD